MAVEAVVGDVQLAAVEPAVERRLGVVERLVPALEPWRLSACFSHQPTGSRSASSWTDMSLHQRVRAEPLGRLEPLALQQRGEFLLERWSSAMRCSSWIGAGGNPYHAAGCSDAAARCGLGQMVGGEELERRPRLRLLKSADIDAGLGEERSRLDGGVERLVRQALSRELEDPRAVRVEPQLGDISFAELRRRERSFSTKIGPMTVSSSIAMSGGACSA